MPKMPLFQESIQITKNWLLFFVGSTHQPKRSTPRGWPRLPDTKSRRAKAPKRSVLPSSMWKVRRMAPRSFSTPLWGDSMVHSQWACVFLDFFCRCIYIYINTFQYYTQSNANTQLSSFYRKTTCPENLMVISDLPIDSVEPFWALPDSIILGSPAFLLWDDFLSEKLQAGTIPQKKRWRKNVEHSFLSIFWAQRFLIIFLHLLHGGFFKNCHGLQVFERQALCHAARDQ